MNAALAILALAGIGGLAMWLALRSAEAKGRAAEQADQSQGVVDAVKEQKAIADSVDAMPAGDARERLRKWSRD